MALEGLQLGQYRLVRLLGSGGMGEVYLAEDARIGQQVALKVSRTEATSYPNHESTADAIRLFQREAKAIARLDHPRILPLYNYGEELINGATLTYIVMPYRREGTLANWLHERRSAGLLPIEDVAYFISQAADALQYAHNHQIVHQDVKPSNFLIRNNPEQPDRPDLLLADFGIAKLSSSTSSISHSIRGTPTYMAPEQWSGEPVAASDQYALAVMAYELLTGRAPFAGRQEQVMYQHFSVQPKPPSSLNSLLPKDVDAVILQALAKNPADRYPSIAAFAKAFQQAVQSSDAPTVIKPISGSGIDTRQRGATPLPLPVNTTPVLHPPSLPPVSATVPQVVPRRQGPSTSRAILLIGLVLIVLIASIGYFAIQGINRIATGNADALATTHANDATSFAATATAQANNSNITGTTTTPLTRNATPTSNIQITPSATPATNANPYPPNRGTLVLDDSLASENATYNWLLYNDSFGACEFTNGAYHISYSKLHFYLFCTAQNTDFSNFAFQVQMTITQGDTGGIVFRTNTAGTNFYYFHISTNGSYGLDAYVDNIRKNATTLTSGTSPSINTNANQANLIAIVANGNAFDLYVNNMHITSISDSNSTYSHGQVGLIADAVNSPTEVVFSNAKVWTF